MPFKFVSRLINNQDPIIITPYGGYANEHKLHLFARVLEDEGISINENHTVLENIWQSFKRFESDEKHNAHVHVSWDGGRKELRSDSEGYIRLDDSHGLALKHPETLWIPVTLRLLQGEEYIYSTTTEIMKPSGKADFLVISDMDDTILDTGVTSLFKWRLLVNSIAKSSYQRMPLDGAAEFCRLLSKGISGFSNNPFFYVSNSPWNIHDYLSAFLTSQDFPKGTLLLRDIGPENKRPKSFMEGTKFLRIKHIIETYPEMKIVLVGDAAEIDTDIYVKLARDHPEQIKAIFIRSVKNKKRTRRVERIIENTRHIEVILFESGTEAAKRAREMGLITN